MHWKHWTVLMKLEKIEVLDPNCDERDLQVDNPLEPPSTQMQRSMALFILTLKEKYKVTQAAIDFTVTQMKDNIDFVIDDLYQAVNKEIKEVPGLSEDDAVRITSVFSNFTNLETQYFQSKFYEENFGLIVSVSGFVQLAIYLFHCTSNQLRSILVLQ